MQHTGLVVWVEGPPEVEFDDDGVSIIYRSGKVEFSTRMSHKGYVRTLHAGLRLAEEWERKRRTGSAEVLMFKNH